MSGPTTTERMAALLDDWASESDPFMGSSRLDFGLTDAQREEPIVKAAAAFATFRFGGLRPQSPAAPFVVMFGDAWQTLQFLRDEHPEVLDIWHSLASYSEHGLIKAMLNDLLWIVRYDKQQRAYIYARSAIANYLRFFDELPNLKVEHRDMHQHDLLCRAAELTKAVKAQEEYLGIARRCEDILGETPGEASYWAVRAAASLPKEHRPAGLMERIEALHASAAASPDRDTRTHSESLFELEDEMTERDRDTAARAQTRARAAQMLIDEARAAESALWAGAALQKAETWAKGAEGESELIGEIRNARTDLAYDDEFHEISVEQSLPTAEIQQLTDTIRDSESVTDAARFLTGCGLRLLGAIGSLEKEAERSLSEPRLINLVSRVHIVHDNIECCRPKSDDAKKRRAIAELFRQQALVAAHLVITPCLIALGDKPHLERADLRRFMSESVAINDFEAEKFERAFELYWGGDHDSAVHVALPRIESSLRNLARKAGIDISFPPPGEECGGFRGLRPILQDLGGVIGESNARMLEYLLVDNHAMNLRDSYGHGVLSADPRSDAALVLWTVLWLAGLREDTAAAQSQA